jgi:signal transduction histidine kinase
MVRPSQTRILRSLRSRILLLALLACVLLGSALTGFIYLIRQTQSTIIADSSTHLLNVVTTFAKDFLGAANASPATTALLQEPPGPPVEDRLRPFTFNAYRRDPGIEGGFYSAATDSLVGYAFPTNDGPGPKHDIPPLERPTILSVAQQAATTGQPASTTFRGQKDVILFQAVPLIENGHAIGSVWGMHRIHDADSGRNLQALLGVSVLAFAALLCVGVAFWITHNVQADVSTIQARLQALERDLSEPGRGQISATELGAIMEGVNRLGVSLQEKIAKERQLVEQLHHKERLASIGQIAAGVAHELRNPLATIRLRTQMSQRSKDAEQSNESARLILEEIDRLGLVLDRLLYFAKPISLQTKSFDPTLLCRDIVDALQPEAERAGIALAANGNGTGTITADSLKLRQVLENLIHNAIESFDGLVRDDKTVTVTVARAGEGVLIVVEDNGAGISDDVARKAFDPFFTTKARGTGLGLSIASEIVRAHGGNLRLKAGTRRGTVAELHLPQLSAEEKLQGESA